MTLPADAAPIAFRGDLPVLVERGTDTVVRLRPARSGQAITPSSATLTLTDASGVVRAGPLTCACADGVVSATVLGTTTSGLPLGDGWRATWSVTLAGESVARPHRAEAALVAARPYPVISDQDVYGRVPSLDPSRPASLVRPGTTFTAALDDAWSALQAHLLGRGRRPWLVVSSGALREPHLLLTLQRVFEDLATRQNEAYGAIADRYRAQADDALANLQLVYEEPEGATTSSGRTPARRPLFLGGVGR